MFFFLLMALLAAGTVGSAAGSAAEPGLSGAVLDARTGAPIPFVKVTLDSALVQVSSSEGEFSFPEVSRGSHVLSFQHLAYARHSVRVEAPIPPLIVRLEPLDLMMQDVLVSGTRPLSPDPAGSLSFSARDLTAAPGNIANDPLRTIQSQPSCAADGVDFLSKTSIRGGDTEESGVTFDGYPLKHFAHAGGFTGVVFDDMLESVALLPGAVPMPYHGTLSGLVVENPAPADSNFAAFRYDITSIAAGVSRALTPTLAVQASAKSSFFNLPAYQEIGVAKRTFRDGLARVIARPGARTSVAGTALLTSDSETGRSPAGSREVRSALLGIDLRYKPGDWEIGLRPSYSFYDSKDGVTSRQNPYVHMLNDAFLAGRIEKNGRVVGGAVYADAGVSRHEGAGGALRDTPFSASAVLRLRRADHLALTLGGGGSREPWTSAFAPEAYAGARIRLGPLAVMSLDARRSHQSPFVFHERRTFASVPIDPGALVAGSSGKRPAVEMDQLSAETVVTLPLRCSLTLDAFSRRYAKLLTWTWSGFPRVANVRSDGEGRSNGYEIVLASDATRDVAFMAAASRARTWKREGSLAEERPGDFDRPHSYQVSVSARFSPSLRLACRWMSVAGRPYTAYPNAGSPPSSGTVNATRLPLFSRFDAKLVLHLIGDGYQADLFLDVLNFFDRQNIAAMYAVETAPGVFRSVPYGGTRMFPIVGASVKW